MEVGVEAGVEVELWWSARTYPLSCCVHSPADRGQDGSARTALPRCVHTPAGTPWEVEEAVAEVAEGEAVAEELWARTCPSPDRAQNRAHSPEGAVEVAEVEAGEVARTAQTPGPSRVPAGNPTGEEAEAGAGVVVEE